MLDKEIRTAQGAWKTAVGGWFLNRLTRICIVALDIDVCYVSSGDGPNFVRQNAFLTRGPLCPYAVAVCVRKRRGKNKGPVASGGLDRNVIRTISSFVGHPEICERGCARERPADRVPGNASYFFRTGQVTCRPCLAGRSLKTGF